MQAQAAATPPEPPGAATATVSAPAEAVPVPAPVQTAGKKPAKNAKNVPTGGGEVTAQGVQKDPYVIGADDILYLNVLHQPDVSSQLTVRPDGFISVRFAGEIKAAGMTTAQLTDVISEKLHTYFNNPEVNIQVQAIRSKKYYVSGNVRKPGAYVLSGPKTVLEAVTEAGGPAEFAKTKGMYVLRGKNQRLPFNYKEVSKGRHLDQNILVRDGDFIVIP